MCEFCVNGGGEGGWGWRNWSAVQFREPAVGPECVGEWVEIARVPLDSISMHENLVTFRNKARVCACKIVENEII